MGEGREMGDNKIINKFFLSSDKLLLLSDELQIVASVKWTLDSECV